MELYNTFEPENHLQPLFDKETFDKLHRWEFGWAILELINKAKGKEDEILLAKRFSPGQKALYFIWYLDAEVTNGGFIQFYWNDNRRYVRAIARGLKLIGDTDTYNLLVKANNEYIEHKNEFILQREKTDWKPLYQNLKNFGAYDKNYYAIHDNMMDLIEKYARQNPHEFVKFK